MCETGKLQFPLSSTVNDICIEMWKIIHHREDGFRDSHSILKGGCQKLQDLHLQVRALWWAPAAFLPSWRHARPSRILNSLYSATQTPLFVVQFLTTTEHGPTVYPSDRFAQGHSGFLLFQTYSIQLITASNIFLKFFYFSACLLSLPWSKPPSSFPWISPGAF